MDLKPGMTGRVLAGVLLLAVLAWGGGLAWFAWRATRPAAPPPQADGIVVLTGGAMRIDAALALLSSHRAGLMLISGVEPHLELGDVVSPAGLALLRHSGLERRITLGHRATTTIGNAAETEAWARSNGLHRLIVVTAGYHMQRALAEIAKALPDATLIAYPVLPPALQRPRSLATLRLLIFEYDKWLLVASGLTGAVLSREPA